MTGRSATAAIYYHPEGYSSARKEVMGRHAAGNAFFTAMARHASAETLFAVAKSEQHFEEFRSRVAQLSGNAKSAAWIPEERLEGLAAPGTLYLPGPNLEEHAWFRRYGDQRAWSLSGITHTISSDRIVVALGALLTAPLQSWDAVICTSEGARTMIHGLTERYTEYLSARLGAPVAPQLPQFPVIPLGVDSDWFTPDDDAKARGKALRAEIGIADDEIVILFVGRLSFHAKAHPMPNFLAAEQAAKATGKKIRLVFFGWSANEYIEREFRHGAEKFAPSVTTSFVDGSDDAKYRAIWHAADIFMTLSDNIQETFGLTPLEAMAAGLPVIVSDWDGYRQTVRDGENGIMVPSWLPAGGTGHDLARAYHQEIDNYDQYIGFTSQFTAIDVAATRAAIEALVNDAELRARMGAASRKRAVEVFDWRVIIGQYEALWAELAERRAKDAEAVAPAPGASFVPLHDDPFTLFAHYPTATVAPGTRVALAEGAGLDTFRHRVAARMNREAVRYLPPGDKIEAAVERLAAEGPLTAADLAAELTREGQAPANYLRTIAWLAKLGLVTLEA